MTENETILLFLHKSPLFKIAQDHRYNEILRVSDQLQSLIDHFKNYSQIGIKLSDEVNAIWENLKDFETKDPITFTSAFAEVTSSLSGHFQGVTKNITGPIQSLVKENLDNLSESKKKSKVEYIKYLSALEMYLSTPIAAKSREERRNALIEAHKLSAVAFFDFVMQMQIAESLLSSFYSNCLSFFVSSFSIIGFHDDNLANAIKGATLMTNEEYDPNLRQEIIDFIPKYYHDMEIPDVNTKEMSKSGFLWKKTGRFAAKWEKRFFTINDGVISCSKTPEEAHSPQWSQNIVFSSISPIVNGSRPFCFSISTKSRTVSLQASSAREMSEWMAIIQNNIEKKLTRDLVSPVGDDVCCDCGAHGTTWIDANYGVSLCSECASFHRGLPNQAVRSVTLDNIDTTTTELHKVVTNEMFNSVFEAGKSDSDCENRGEFIRRKYVEKAFVVKKTTNIYESMKNGDYKGVIEAIACNEIQALDGNFTPLMAAASIGNPLILALVVRNSNLLQERDANGFTALDYAMYYGNRLCVSILRELGCEFAVSEGSFTPINTEFKSIEFDETAFRSQPAMKKRNSLVIDKNEQEQLRSRLMTISRRSSFNKTVKYDFDTMYDDEE